ncbi:MAG TPA: histidine phosphatase family protein [Lunatimonas sp.]|nr:histidine phosphatase family protein [Lunatimonas sp.]
MKRTLSFFLIISLGYLVLAGCQREVERKLYLFRHAEKIMIGDDPELTQAGQERADRLAKSLGHRSINAIYSTPTIRTRATVTPLAKSLSVPIMEYSAQDHDALVNTIRSGSGDVVVVGHSNTIHHIANYFRGDLAPFDELDESDYDTFFEVDLKKNTVVRKRYSDL